MRKVLFGLGGTVWFLGLFMLGLKLFFPAEQAAERLKWEVSDKTGGQLALETDKVGLWRMGATLHSPELFLKPKPKGRRGAEEEVALNRVLVADKVSARVKPLKLMGGTAAVVIDAALYDGDLEGQVDYGLKDGTVYVEDLRGKDIDLSRYPFDFEKFSADVEGLAKLRVTKLTYDPQDVSNSTGKLRLEIDGLSISGLQVMGIDLPETTFSEAILALTLKDSEARVKKGSFKGDTMEIQVGGKVKLGQKLNRSTFDLTFDVRLLDESLDGLAGLAPGVKDAKDAEGVYHFSLTGRTERPSFRPVRQRSATPAGNRGGRQPTVRAPNPGAGPAVPQNEIDAEERRRRREERIAARREQMREEREARPADPMDLEDEVDFDEDEDEIYDDEDDLPDELDPLDEEPFDGPGGPDDELMDMPIEGGELYED